MEAATIGAIISHPALGWKQRLHAQRNEEASETTPKLYPCGHCGLEIKIGLTAVTAGAYDKPPMVYENKYFPHYPRGWWKPPRTVFLPPVMDRVDCDPSPLQDRNWLDSNEHTWEAEIYINICKNYAKFSVAALGDIVKNGTALVHVAGGLVQAARQIQKVHM